MIRAALAAVLLAVSAHADVVLTALPYADGDTTLDGRLVVDTATPAPRPGVIMFHAWGGPGAHEEQRARELAAQGYAVLIADVYGAGVRPATRQERVVETTKYRGDRALMRSRARAALDVLRAQPDVGPTIAAMGFCFGGTVALELARDGADLAGAISLHGALDTSRPAQPGAIRCPVLVLHGGDDPLVPDAEVTAFRNEMRQAGAAWRIIEYGGAVHAFTDPAAGTDPATGAAYDAEAAWLALRDLSLFLRDVLAR